MHYVQEILSQCGFSLPIQNFQLATRLLTSDLKIDLMLIPNSSAITLVDILQKQLKSHYTWNPLYTFQPQL